MTEQQKKELAREVLNEFTTTKLQVAGLVISWAFGGALGAGAYTLMLVLCWIADGVMTVRERVRK